MARRHGGRARAAPTHEELQLACRNQGARLRSKQLVLRCAHQEPVVCALQVGPDHSWDPEHRLELQSRCAGTAAFPLTISLIVFLGRFIRAASSACDIERSSSTSLRVSPGGNTKSSS